MKFNTVLCVTAVILLNITGSICQLEVCGRAPFNTKIVGGQDASEGSWPWQVSIHTVSGGHSCGGSLINKDWVLSAAHCFQSDSVSNIIIYLGRRNQTGSNPHEVFQTVSRVINHPNYNKTTSDNDIALLKLSSSVNFTDYIRPVCLAALGSIFVAGNPSWITGWGTLSSAGGSPNTLQEVEVPIVNNFDCNNAYGGKITSNMMCAGLLNEGGKDSCQGDSGGPMVSEQDSLWIQSGVVSFGIGCADPKFPGVYTRVSQYQDWINSHISSNQPGFVSFPISETDSSSRGSLNLLLFSLSLMFSTIPFFLSLYLFS